MTDLAKEILTLKKKKNAIILAHYYQTPEIQEIADYVGDSLGLSQEAAKTNADIIVFSGVYFMAETAKILNPTKKVLVPDGNAGCSLADNCQPPEFAEFLLNYPNHIVVTYVNCSAEIKAMSDIVCTSSNAQKVIESIPKNQPIVFAPDKNLGAYLKKKTGRDMVLWEGSCMVHEAFSIDKILTLHQKYPEAKIVAHPESEEPVLKVANYVGSTSGMIDYVKKSSNRQFIIATEAGILHEMQKVAIDKELIAAPALEENSCSCSECSFMKMNNLQKIYNALLFEKPEVFVEESIRLKALKPVERMLELSK